MAVIGFGNAGYIFKIRFFRLPTVFLILNIGMAEIILMTGLFPKVWAAFCLCRLSFGVARGLISHLIFGWRFYTAQF